MKRMLIMEDDDLSQKYLRRLFQNDYELNMCASSEEYYLNYSKIDYNIIIMDISLKGRKDGLELIKEIRIASLNSRTPILCLTAHAQAKTKKMAIEAGADLFITKPAANDVLKDAVTSLERLTH